MRQREGEGERERAREIEGGEGAGTALMFAATTHHKVNSKGWFKNA